MIRLYGHQKSESSFVQVTRGMRAAAKAAGVFAGEIAVDLPDEERAAPGAAAYVALYCGAPLSAILGHREGMHKQHWLVLAPNSSGVPPMLAQKLKQRVPSFVEAPGPACALASVERPLLTGFLAPSQWAAEVLRRTFPEHRVIVSPHGVHPEVHCPSLQSHQERCAEFAAGKFRVVHFTSTLGQRKGTPELLRAWCDWKDRPPRARLVVVSNPLGVNEYLWRLHELGLDETTVDVVANPEAPIATLAEALRHAHMICQPSRGEGFGLLPLEARACGVPVVATACTGHSQHIQVGDPGVVVVPHGELAPMDDYPGSMAPAVTSAAVLEALRSAYARWPGLAEGAMDNADMVGREWSWERQNAGVLKALVDAAS